jgi:hypothetical protein
MVGGVKESGKDTMVRVIYLSLQQATSTRKADVAKKRDGD